MPTTHFIVLADAESAHLEAYLHSSARIRGCNSVVVAAPSRTCEKDAHETLEEKPKWSESSH